MAKKSESQPPVVLERRSSKRYDRAWLCGEGDSKFSIYRGLRKHLRYQTFHEQWLVSAVTQNQSMEQWLAAGCTLLQLRERFVIPIGTPLPSVGKCIEVLVAREGVSD